MVQETWKKIVPLLDEDTLDFIERESDLTGKPLTADPYNYQGMMEAESLAEVLREKGYAEPFLLLAFENRQERAPEIWAELERAGIDGLFKKAEGGHSAVIAAKYSAKDAGRLHGIAAEILNLPFVVQGSDPGAPIRRRKVQPPPTLC